MRRLLLAGSLAVLLGFVPGHADVERRVVNNGQLIIEDVPPIPADLEHDLSRYQNVRSAGFVGWDEAGESIYVRTRFADVVQLHRVDAPGGARHQLTFFDEPIGAVTRQPGGSLMTYTMDVGGSEFDQIFLFDPATGESRMLTDGDSLNRGVVWDRTGTRIAYTSTRRNGRSFDLWVMDIDDPASARMVFESSDGSGHTAVDFHPNGRELLFGRFVSVTDSEVRLLDLTTSEDRMLVSGGSNRPMFFDASGERFFFVTDREGEYRDFAVAPVAQPTAIHLVTADISWDFDGGAHSVDRRWMLFDVNENGICQPYLLNLESLSVERIEGLPVGLISGIGFNPRGDAVALTLNSSTSSSDVYVLGLEHGGPGDLERWTFSEVGGLDTATFVEPTLETFESFDGRSISTFVYRPPGPGPHPVVVRIHGGPAGQSRPGFNSTYQMWIRQLGAAVVVPNVRGSTGYGKTFVGLDDGRRREDSVKDIGALLDWIATQDDLDADRVALYGGSYGGYMVLASAVHYSDRLVGAVDVVGISNWVTFLENTQAYRRDLRRVEYGDERDPDMRAFLESISPLNHLDRIEIPLLVVQGANDPRVPVTESVQLVEGLRARGQGVWFMNALNEGHGYARKENRDIFQQVTVMFLAAQLGLTD